MNTTQLVSFVVYMRQSQGRLRMVNNQQNTYLKEIVALFLKHRKSICGDF